MDGSNLSLPGIHPSTWLSPAGEVVAMSAAPHLGVAEGDEVLSINDVVIQDMTPKKTVTEMYRHAACTHSKIDLGRQINLT